MKKISTKRLSASNGANGHLNEYQVDKGREYIVETIESFIRVLQEWSEEAFQTAQWYISKMDDEVTLNDIIEDFGLAMVYIGCIGGFMQIAKEVYSIPLISKEKDKQIKALIRAAKIKLQSLVRKYYTRRI